MTSSPVTNVRNIMPAPAAALRGLLWLQGVLWTVVFLRQLHFSSLVSAMSLTFAILSIVLATRLAPGHPRVWTGAVALNGVLVAVGLTLIGFAVIRTITAQGTSDMRQLWLVQDIGVAFHYMILTAMAGAGLLILRNQETKTYFTAPAAPVGATTAEEDHAGEIASQEADSRLRIRDPVFGELTWNGQLSVWEGQGQLNGAEIALVLHSAGPEDVSARLETYRNLWSHIVASEASIRRKAADDLLEVFNSEWNDDEEGKVAEPLDADAFLARMALDWVEFRRDGRAQVCYDSGDLFPDHLIAVNLDSNGNVVRAEIEQLA